MAVLSDGDIINRVDGYKGFTTWAKKLGLNIDPFENKLVNKDKNGNKIISYGLSSYGYDIRLGNKFLRMPKLTKFDSAPIDPLKDNSSMFEEVICDDPYILDAHDFVLAHSLELVRVPRDIAVICMGKSTYARTGLVVNTTPLEPEWSGYITLELSNTTNRPIVLYPGQGIAQLVFHIANTECVVSYADRGGKYQDQPNKPILPKV